MAGPGTGPLPLVAGRNGPAIIAHGGGNTAVRVHDYLHHGADYTPYEGLAVTGWPVMTILRGKPVFEEGRILGEPGDGMFLKRPPPGGATPR